jgi:hypothetical protein
MNVAQLPNALNHQRPQQLQHLHQAIQQLLLQQSSPTFSPQLLSVLITTEHHETTVKSGKSMIANHAVALLQALLNALSKHVTLQNAKKEPI